jgi:hypothetical protein
MKMPNTQSLRPRGAECTWTCHNSHFMLEFTRKCQSPSSRRTVCASPRNRNSHGHGMSQGNFTRHFREKCRDTKSRRRVCVSLRNRNATGHVIRPILRENLQKKWRGPRSRCAVCACLRSWNAHDMSQEPFDARIYWRNAWAQDRGAEFVGACAVTRAIWRENSQEKGRKPDGTNSASTLTGSYGRFLW